MVCHPHQHSLKLPQIPAHFGNISPNPLYTDSAADLYLYADEFQNYTTLSLAAMLSELRKYIV